MLYLTFQEPTDKQKLILYSGDIFDYISEDEWFYDEEVKNIIKVIDKSTLINENTVNFEVDKKSIYIHKSLERFQFRANYSQTGISKISLF